MGLCIRRTSASVRVGVCGMMCVHMMSVMMSLIETVKGLNRRMKRTRNELVTMPMIMITIIIIYLP